MSLEAVVTGIASFISLLIVRQVFDILQGTAPTQRVQKPFYIYADYSRNPITISGPFAILSARNGGKVQSMAVLLSPGDFTLSINIDGNVTNLPRDKIMEGAFPLPDVAYVQVNNVYQLMISNVDFSSYLAISISPADQLQIFGYAIKGYTYAS